MRTIPIFTSDLVLINNNTQIKKIVNDKTIFMRIIAGPERRRLSSYSAGGGTGSAAPSGRSAEAASVPFAGTSSR